MRLQYHSWAYTWRGLHQYARDTCIPMFIALFTINKPWNQSRWPTINEWIKKYENVCVCVYIHIHIYTYVYTHTHTMDYNSAIKKNWIMSFAGKWREIIMLSETFLLICETKTENNNDEDTGNNTQMRRETLLGEVSGRGHRKDADGWNAACVHMKTP
jgi:hypothetical protein